MDEPDAPYRDYAIALFPCVVVYIGLELTQFMSFYRTGAVRSYLTDTWNLLDVATIVLVLSLATKLLMAESSLGNMQHLIFLTALFLFLKLVSLLKQMFLPFAIFVSGVLKVCACSCVTRHNFPECRM